MPRYPAKPARQCTPPTDHPLWIDSVFENEGESGPGIDPAFENEGESGTAQMPYISSPPIKATSIRGRGPTMKDCFEKPGAEEPEAEPSSILCRRILAVLEQHHAETMQRLDKLAAGRRLSASSGDGSLEISLDCLARLDSNVEMGNDLFGMDIEATDAAISPPDNHTPGNGNNISTGGEVKATSSKGHHGDDGDSQDSEDRRRRHSAIEHGSSMASVETFALTPAGSRCRDSLRRLLHSTASELFFFIAILANSLLIGAEVQYMAEYPHDPTEVFINLNVGFTLLFLLELVARCWLDGLRRFWRSQDWAWNMLDLFIVVTSMAEVGFKLFATVESVDNVSNLRIMRVFRIVRVGKALRIQRLIRFISALRTLVYSIFVTLRSLVWAVILLLIIMYIFGIIITQFCVERLHDGTGPDIPRLGKFWGSLWASMLTLFQSITGGISWYEVTDPLAEVSRVLVGVFITYIFLITFAVFNVITGIFCHSAIETAVRDPDLAAQAMLQDRKQYIQRIKKLFRDVDEDCSGVISLQELEAVVKDENVRAYFAALDLDLSDAWTIFKLMAGKKNVIDQDTFVKGCLKLRGNARRQDCVATLAEMQVLLRKFSSFAKLTTQKLDGLSAPGALLRPQKRQMSRLGRPGDFGAMVSQWSQSVGSETM